MDQKELLHFPKRALFVVNPVAGRKTIQKHLPDCVRALMDAGYLVTTMVTAERGEATQYAKTYGKFYDLVVCAGGDGTLNETVTGLAESHANVPVGYIPCGTTNDFSASHGLPKDIPGAMQGIVSEQRARYDVGCFADQYFVGVALFGAFSWMAYTTEQTKKNKLGYHAYMLDGVRDLSRLKPIHMRLEDGTLELVLVKAPRSLPELDQLLRAITAGDFAGHWLTLRHVKNMKVHNPPELQWSLDGEKSGWYETVEIRALPGFLELQGGK